jgi:hypothetical protein
MITIEKNSYIVSFRYDRATVETLKALIPATERKYDGSRKSWIVSFSQYATLKQIFTGFNIPAPPTRTNEKQTKILDVRYIGKTKDRGGAERTAFGYSDGDWSVVFPESVLKQYLEGFVDVETPSGTHYAILGVPKSANADEIKRGYRRMAKQWHPDVCREPNAQEVFLSVQAAYELLSNPNKKARYDAGLMFSQSQPKPAQAFDTVQDGYAPRYRCGWIMADGHDVLGRFVVDKILGWQEITNDKGETLVTSWAFGDDTFTEAWV